MTDHARTAAGRGPPALFAGLSRTGAVAFDRVLGAREAAIAPRADQRQPDLLEHPDRRRIVGERMSEDAAVAEHVERVTDERACPLGRVPEAPGVAAEAVAELGLVLATGRRLELEPPDEGVADAFPRAVEAP